MDKKDYTEKNRQAWNEASLKHREFRNKKGDPILQDGFIDFDEIIIRYLKEFGRIEGARVVNLCCNDGRETISLKRMGAAECVGFDISDEAIQTAKDLSNKTGVKCEFIRSDVYDIDPEKFSSFDLAFISAGALSWLGDLDELFQIVSGLLKKRGRLLIYEIHPFAWLLEEAPPENPLQISGSYFKDGPVITHGALDYVGNEDYDGLVNYSFDHTIGEILTSLIRAGIKIEEFRELPGDVSAVFSHLEKMGISLPLSYILCAKKEG